MFWNLKDEMRRAGITTEKLAETAGIATSSMTKKLNGHTDFKLGEVKKIVALFPHRDWEYLFDDGRNDTAAG